MTLTKMDMLSAPDPTGQIVDEQLRSLIESEKQLLKQLHGLAVAGGHTEDARRLSDILAGVDELFLLVIVGEFNAGKS